MGSCWLRIGCLAGLALITSACQRGDDPHLRPSDEHLERLLTPQARAKAASVNASIFQQQTAALDSLCPQVMRIVEQGQLVLRKDNRRVVVDGSKWSRLPQQAQFLIKQCLAKVGKNGAGLELLQGSPQ